MVYKDFYLFLECPVTGQERKECASHPACHRTCDNLVGGPCPLICIINGCECPNGTVIDENANECVAPSECEQGLCINCIIAIRFTPYAIIF